MANAKKIMAVDRVIAQEHERVANFDLALRTFAQAFDELRRAVPVGNINVRLWVEVDDAGPSPVPGDLTDGGNDSLV